MVVKAKDSVTIVDQTDIDHLAIWYFSQSATLSAPAAPTTTTTSSAPTGWSTSEPTFDSDNPSASLALAVYTCQQTVWTNGACTWGAVSKSTSYEAAKAAYNKAVAAGSEASSASDKADTALSQTAEFITGTQTAATNAWTGTSSTISALYDGLQITYWLPYAGTSSAATLNLTLSGGGTTGAKNVYYRGTTRATTHYAAGSTIRLTYRVGVSISGSGSYTGWWADGSYEGSNTYDRTRYSNAVKSLDALTKSTYYIMVGTSAGYKKAASGVSFDVSYPVLTWYYTSAVAANATTSYMYAAMPSVTLRNNVAGWTGTQYSMVYLVGTLSGKTFTINSTVFTCTAPTSADGLFYIPIGILSNTYQIYFRSDQTIYAYGENGFAPVSANANAAVKSLVKDVDVMYAQGSSSTTAPTSGWSTDAPAWVDGKFIWQKTVTTYGDDTTSESAATCITGATGAAGADGKDGSAGKGVTSIVEQYYQSTSSSTQTGGSWVTSVPTWVDGKYVWTRSVITYTDGNSTTTSPVCVTGAKGTNGSQGEQGYSIVASVSRPSFTEAQWTTYGTVGHVENWSNTESTRNGCRVGDIFTVVGTATDTKNAHVAYYKSDTASGNLHGECIAHSIAERGAKGEDGADGTDGVRGTGIYRVTTAPSSYTTATGGFTPTYRIALSTVLTQSGATEILVGDQLRYSYYLYPVGYVDSSYVYLAARTSIRGSTGAAGANGQMLYATSETAAATAAKVATLASGSLTLAAGATVSVEFTNANTAANPTLNVGGTGAKAIKLNGAAYAYWLAGATVSFVYDGTDWQVCSTPLYGSTATIGNPASYNAYIDGDSFVVRHGESELLTVGISEEQVEISTRTDYPIRLKKNESILSVETNCVRASANSIFPMVLESSYATSAYVMASKTLYDNASGTNGNVTLSSEAWRYRFIDILFGNGDGRVCGVTRVHDPDGKTVELSANLVGENGYANIYFARYTISDTTLTKSLNNTLSASLNDNWSVSTAGYLYVVAVIGYV